MMAFYINRLWTLRCGQIFKECLVPKDSQQPEARICHGIRRRIHGQLVSGFKIAPTGS